MKAHSCSKRLRWFVLVLPFCSISYSAAAAEYQDKGMQPQRLAAPAGMTPAQAAAKVRRETGGQILGEPTRRAGARGYEVRVLLDGKRVKKVFVDARPKR